MKTVTPLIDIQTTFKSGALLQLMLSNVPTFSGARNRPHSLSEVIAESSGSAFNVGLIWARNIESIEREACCTCSAAVP